tara:strand:- start:8183 stop:9670 length:1488 start_codon:yes stop_codon:yes gene_type:complete
MYKVLPLVKKTLNKFHALKVNYCHFKSNEHVDAAVSGLTDLDILFAYDEYEKVDVLLQQLGFQKCTTAWYVSYPYVEDYIAFDEGKIIHIHAHFKLILGESKVKSYILSWEEEILKTKVFNKEYGIYTSDPIHEMLLLIIRTALKLPVSDLNYQKRRDVVDAIREFEWLKSRISKNEILQLTNAYFNEKVAAFIGVIYDQNISYNIVRNFYTTAKRKLNTYRRYSFLKSKWIKQIRRVSIILLVINRKLKLYQGIRMHRTFDTDKGLIISIMGADGSGKSTQVKRVKTILSKKIDVRYIYMGSGNGPASWHRDLLKFAGSILKKNKKGTSPAKIVKFKFSFKSIFMIIYLLSLAIEKKTKLKRLSYYRKHGMLCITDRYPQTQIEGYNDGLHMGEWKNTSSLILKQIAKFERKCYALSEEIAPDIVVKLIGDINVLKQRRPEMTYQEIEKKQNGIKSLSFDKHVEVIEMDASLDMEEITSLILENASQRLTNQEK